MGRAYRPSESRVKNGMNYMKRRHFIKTTFFALVAAYAPISLRPLEAEDETSERTLALTLDLQELVGKLVPGMTFEQLSDVAYKRGVKIKVESIVERRDVQLG